MQLELVGKEVDRRIVYKTIRLLRSRRDLGAMVSSMRRISCYSATYLGSPLHSDLASRKFCRGWSCSRLTADRPALFAITKHAIVLVDSLVATRVAQDIVHSQSR